FERRIQRRDRGGRFAAEIERHAPTAVTLLLPDREKHAVPRRLLFRACVLNQGRARIPAEIACLRDVTVDWRPVERDRRRGGARPEPGCYSTSLSPCADAARNRCPHRRNRR